MGQYDVRIKSSTLYFIPIETRMPLKFGNQVLKEVTCARVKVEVEDQNGRVACGWGETPLSVAWAWPADLPYDVKHDAMRDCCRALNQAFGAFEASGHPIEISQKFSASAYETAIASVDASRPAEAALPHLTSLVCYSAFDIALHDAYGQIHEKPIYELYNAPYVNDDLSCYLEPADQSDVDFTGKYPADYLRSHGPRIAVWHLVGGLDPLDASELTGEEPDDGYPTTLIDWIRRDQLNCLKVKLRGNDWEWDLARLVKVGQMSIEEDVDWLTTDFNCTVTDPDYVNTILDRIKETHPRIYGKILYVEQPFPYDLENNRIDVHSCSSRKPLFMDESAHDWRFVKMGYELGWNGVALKTCKTQTGALLSMCWATAHGMGLMVQDLTNPMLAQVPHVLLGAYAQTIMGVESNGMQFYPEASRPEWEVHPGLYQRRDGVLDFSTLSGHGFGYRIDEIDRQLPEPE